MCRLWITTIRIYCWSPVILLFSSFRISIESENVSQSSTSTPLSKLSLRILHCLQEIPLNIIYAVFFESIVYDTEEISLLNFMMFIYIHRIYQCIWNIINSTTSYLILIIEFWISLVSSTTDKWIHDIKCSKIT